MLKSSHRKSRRHASTIVETALCLTFILLPITVLIIQMGVFLNASLSLQQIAREAGRFAAVHGKESTFLAEGTGTFNSIMPTNPTQSSPPSLYYYIKQNCLNTNVIYSDIKSISVTPADPASRTSGSAITVTMIYPMTKKTFLGNNAWVKVLAHDQAFKATFVLE